MAKKLSYDYVKQYIESFDYTLLPDSYVNAQTKLKLRCDKGHEYKVKWNKFQQGRRCPVCAGNKKYSYDNVRQYVESFGYTLLSDTYKNNNTKLKIKCDKGHEYNVTFSSFKQGYRCPVCYGNKKYSYDNVKQYVENEGYTLLSDTYKNSKEKLKLRCPEGHEYKVTFNDFKNDNNRCPICSNRKKYSYNDVKRYIESFDYTLLSDTYENNKIKLKVRCDKGHEYEVGFKTFKNGHRCPICAGNVKLSYDYIKQYIENEGHTLLSKSYKNNSTKLKLRCDKGHEYKITFGNFYMGYRCSICNKSSSIAEKEIADLVKKLLPDKTILTNDRTQIINPLTGYYLELDIFIPALNKAIEYNGVYWHSLPKAIIKDKIKKEQCQEKNIDLLIIEENEWINDKNNFIKKISKFLLT